MTRVFHTINTIFKYTFHVSIDEDNLNWLIQ